MLRILRTLPNPLGDKLHLARREFLGPFSRRHDQIGIGRRDSLHQLAVLGLARHDGRIATQVAGGPFRRIEPQPLGPFGTALAFLLVGSVAAEAVVGEDLANLAVEIDLLRRQQGGGEREHETQGENALHRLARYVWREPQVPSRPEYGSEV